MRPTKGPHG